MRTTDDQLKQIKALKRELQSLLDDLARDHLSLANPDQPFPSLDQLNHLTDAIVRLARATNKKRFSFTHIWQIIITLNRRYQKLGLIDALDKLLNKLVSIPQGPVTKIRKQLETNRTNARLLIKLTRMIKKRSFIQDHPNIDWRKVFDVLWPFTDRTFQKLTQRNRKETTDFNYQHRLQPLKPALGFAAFLHVQRQHLLWVLNYQESFNNTASWLYSLQNPHYDAQLRQAYCESGKLPLPDEFKQIYKKALAANRQKRHRRATIAST